MNDHSFETTLLPRIGINTEELIAEVERLLRLSADHKAGLGAVNWGDLGIADIEYRLSIMQASSEPWCVVTIEEASPGCELQGWLNERLDKTKFPNTYIECEW